MVITPEWIHKHKTKRGGWTRKQLAAIGVMWPPRQGWISRVSGAKISDQQRMEFEMWSIHSRLEFPLSEANELKGPAGGARDEQIESSQSTGATWGGYPLTWGDEG